MSLRDCLRLQTVQPHTLMRRTLFGRAKMMTGAHPIYSEEPDCYMMYWIRLPVFEHRYSPWRDAFAMQQATLAWHGKHGFRVFWDEVDP